MQSVSSREVRLGCIAAYTGNVYRYCLAYIQSRCHKERGASWQNRNEQPRPFQEKEQLEEILLIVATATVNSNFHPTVLKFANTGWLLAMSPLLYNATKVTEPFNRATILPFWLAKYYLAGGLEE
jgi:hypothetical protein